MWDNSGNISLLLPAFVAFLTWLLLRKRPKSTLPYPPGPKEYPLIGNLLDFPLGVPLWEGLSEMAGQHGTIFPSLTFLVGVLMINPRNRRN